MGSMVVTREILVEKFGTIFPHLDESRRRLLMGAEARALGHGGIPLVVPGRAGPRGGRWRTQAGCRPGSRPRPPPRLPPGARPLRRAHCFRTYLSVRVRVSDSPLVRLSVSRPRPRPRSRPRRRRRLHRHRHRHTPIFRTRVFGTCIFGTCIFGTCIFGAARIHVGHPRRAQHRPHRHPRLRSCPR